MQSSAHAIKNTNPTNSRYSEQRGWSLLTPPRTYSILKSRGNTADDYYMPIASSHLV